MKLSKAKEILDLHWRGHKNGLDPDFFNAVYIGSQAISRITANRKDGFPRIWTPLPGETRDESWKGH